MCFSFGPNENRQARSLIIPVENVVDVVGVDVVVVVVFGVDVGVVGVVGVDVVGVDVVSVDVVSCQR